MYMFNIIKGSKHVFVANFECSLGVVGERCFKAHEKSWACKNWNVRKNTLEFLIKVSNIYSYGIGIICWWIH